MSIITPLIGFFKTYTITKVIMIIGLILFFPIAFLNLIIQTIVNFGLAIVNFFIAIIETLINGFLGLLEGVILIFAGFIDLVIVNPVNTIVGFLQTVIDKLYNPLPGIPDITLPTLSTVSSKIGTWGDITITKATYLTGYQLISTPPNTVLEFILGSTLYNQLLPFGG